MNMLLKFCKEEIPIKEVTIEIIYKDKENYTSHFNPVKDSIKIEVGVKNLRIILAMK